MYRSKLDCSPDGRIVYPLTPSDTRSSSASIFVDRNGTDRASSSGTSWRLVPANTRVGTSSLVTPDSSFCGSDSASIQMMNSAAKTMGGRTSTPSRSSASAHFLTSTPIYDPIRFSPLQARSASVACIGSSVSSTDLATLNSSRSDGLDSAVVQHGAGRGLVASLSTQANASTSPSNSRQTLPNESEPVRGPSKPPKSPGTSRIAKLRAAWSPKNKISALPGASDSQAANPGKKERGSKTFSGVTSRSKQRVSLVTIGSPTLMRFTTLNEHGEVVNYEPSSTGIVPLGNAIPLTSLQAAAKTSVQTGVGMDSGGDTSVETRISNQDDSASTLLNRPIASLAYSGVGLGPSPRTSESNLRSKRHASVEVLPRSISFDHSRISGSRATAPSSPQAPVRPPLPRFRAVRERSATQGEYSSPFKESYAQPRVSADGCITRPYLGGMLGHGVLDPVAELQGASVESGGDRLQAIRQAPISLLAPMVIEPRSMSSTSGSIVRVPSLTEAKVRINDHEGDEESQPSLSSMWSQATDMSGYTASSESGRPVPDALGLVLPGSTRREDIIRLDNAPPADQVSDTSVSQISQGTTTVEHTPSTLATACSPRSPGSVGGDHTFGSTAPRSPVHQRKVHVRPPSLLAESPSLDQILPGVELSTYGTPMPDASFEDEINEAEQRRMQRAPSPFGNNMLGLSGPSMLLDTGFNFRAASDYDGSDGASPVNSMRQNAANAAQDSVLGSGVSRASTASTSTAARFQRKYMFEKVASPEQHRLLLEEEEWSCRGLQEEDVGCGFPAPPLGKSHGRQASRFSHSEDSQDDSGEQDCPSIYEVSSVEGSADGIDKASEDEDVNEDGGPYGSQLFPQSGSGWEVGSERAIFGLYEDSDQADGSEAQQTSESSPRGVINNISKRDTVESLLARAAELLTDQSGPRLRHGLAASAAAAGVVEEAFVSDGDEMDIDAELVTEGLEVDGPVDPVTGMVSYKLKWKILLRTRNGSKARQTAGICKVVSGTSKVSSPATLNVSLPVTRTPENRSLSFGATSPGTASIHSSDDGLTVAPAFLYSSHGFANPFYPGQRLRSSVAEDGDIADAPVLQFHTASYPASLSTSDDDATAAQDMLHHADGMELPTSPRSPAFCPKPLLLVQNTDARTTSTRKRFDSNAEYTSSPASKASSEFSRPSIGRSAHSSPAMDASVGRRRQLSYISVCRGSFDRPRIPSGSRSPYLSSTPMYVEDSTATPRSNIISQPEHPRDQTPSLNTASGRLAAITSGG
ncbi:hypothetical protein CF327_g2834 [Tilletia walkeri]|nr:hypothetical protein CF327_g2834 [Tilletia walkeri]